MQMQRKRQRQFAFKVSNIPRSIRVKTFKSELREIGIIPLFIVWKGLLKLGAFLSKLY